MHTSKHRLTVLAGTMLALMIPLSAVQAASPNTVDPDSLSPALNRITRRTTAGRRGWHHLSRRG